VELEVEGRVCPSEMTISLGCFRLMTCQNFEGSTCFTDSHDTIQDMAGNVTWFNQYVPSGEDRIAEVILRL